MSPGRHSHLIPTTGSAQCLLRELRTPSHASLLALTVTHCLEMSVSSQALNFLREEYDLAFFSEFLTPRTEPENLENEENNPRTNKLWYSKSLLTSIAKEASGSREKLRAIFNHTVHMQSYCLSAKKHFVLLSRLNMPLHKCVNILLLLSKSSSYELFKGKLYPQVGLSKPPCLCACINLVSPILKRNYSSAPHTSQISTNFLFTLGVRHL